MCASSDQEITQIATNNSNKTCNIKKKARSEILRLLAEACVASRANTAPLTTAQDCYPQLKAAFLPVTASRPAAVKGGAFVRRLRNNASLGSKILKRSNLHKNLKIINAKEKKRIFGH